MKTCDVCGAEGRDHIEIPNYKRKFGKVKTLLYKILRKEYLAYIPHVSCSDCCRDIHDVFVKCGIIPFDLAVKIAKTKKQLISEYAMEHDKEKLKEGE